MFLLDVFTDVFKQEPDLFNLENFCETCSNPKNRAKFAMEMSMRLDDSKMLVSYFPESSLVQHVGLCPHVPGRDHQSGKL